MSQVLPINKKVKNQLPKEKKQNEKVVLTTSDGKTVEAFAPVIVSASRATDIPAFYADWFFRHNVDKKLFIIKTKTNDNGEKFKVVGFANGKKDKDGHVAYT